jgi:hypothetical protein
MPVGSYSCVGMPRKAAATRLTRPKSPLPRYVADSMMELMRHESIETTLRFYVGTDAQRAAEAAWTAFEALQRVFAGPVASCRWGKPSMAFFHFGDTQKSQGFLGSPIAASRGGRLYPQSANSLANSSPSGRVDAAPSEERPEPENTARKRSRPGVIRTHDQGIMSGDEPEE